jgi:hypothetical protein
LTGCMARLSVQLQEARLQERPSVPYVPPSTDQEQYKALLRKMVGRTVLITVKGKHQGKQGTITRHAGDTFRPVNWYVLLPDGSEVRKHKNSFKLLPRVETAAAATASDEEED